MVRSLTVVTTLVLGPLAPLGQVLAWSPGTYLLVGYYRTGR